MVSRKPRAHISRPVGIPGDPRLTLAQIIVALENIAQAFAQPLLLAGFFIVLAWLGFFTALYPWAHIAALVLFVAVFFDALGRARLHYRRTSHAAARRRVEKSSGLSHRPLDALLDRPAIAGNEQNILWQTHLEQSREQLKHLRWPRWMLDFTDRDPYALRYALLILLALGAVSSWGAWGGRLLGAINPELSASASLFKPALDAWITPPEYTGMPPIMIVTPAGQQHGKEALNIPTGSTITAHLAEKDGEAPELLVNGESTEFSADDHNDFGVTAVIKDGNQLVIRRGWQNLASWKIHVVPDEAPHISFAEAPAVSERKSVRLAWTAMDDYGVTSVTAHITPRESLPGASATPIDIQLATPDAKEAKRVSFEDLTANPWAGISVQIQLTATDAVGHVAQSEPADFVLPERVFFNPLARALIDERRKLLQNPGDDAARNEAANVMAGIAAGKVADYRGDPLVLMALRAGAVRLVLDRSEASVPPVIDILWQTAVRIEDGTMGVAEANLRQAQKELADALDRNASQPEIQKLIDRLHEALGQYLAQLAAQAATQPPMANELNQVLGQRTNMLTPQDLDRMLENMRSMSAAGSREEARDELARLQQLLENLHTGQPQLNAQQKEALKKIAALRELSNKQRQLLDNTFRQAQASKDATGEHQLALQQDDIRKALRSLIDNSKGDDATDDLDQSEGAMKDAGADLNQGQPHGAVQHQNEALAALDKAIQGMSENLRASMFALPQPGAYGQNSDPFGRGSFGGFANDDAGIHVPDRMETRRVREILDELQHRAGDTDRPKTERDYIDRLLQNF